MKEKKICLSGEIMRAINSSHRIDEVIKGWKM
jgi:hypothetical protein